MVCEWAKNAIPEIGEFARNGSAWSQACAANGRRKIQLMLAFKSGGCEKAIWLEMQFYIYRFDK